MAKWGEGDPRWIVEERPDATNVNNWHWTEKNATPWSKDRLQDLFKHFEIKQDDFVCTIDEIEKISGEATVNNRKGKLIFFYEWDMVFQWSGKHPDMENNHKGKISIPNLSEENDLNDVEITITIDESNDESEQLKLFMYNIGRDKIRQQLGLYIKELKEEYSKNLILPKKGETSTSIPVDQQKAKINLSNGSSTDVPMSSSGVVNTKSGLLGCKLDVKTLEMSVVFHCSANDLYNALTKHDMITLFTNGPAKVDATRGGEFSLYGGNVHGKFEELIPEKKIKQSWRLKSWPSGHFSEVQIDLQEGGSGTKMTLKQTGIPSSEYDSMYNNWSRYYWNSIKQTFGFGATIADAF